MITRPPSFYGSARSPGRPRFVSVEPEQGEVINGPNLGDLLGGELVQVLATAAQPSPWSTSRSSSSPRPSIPFELPDPSSWRPLEARSSSRSSCGLLWLSLVPKQSRAILTATDSDETSDCVQWCLGFFSVRSCRGVSLPPVSVTDRARFLGVVVYFYLFSIHAESIYLCRGRGVP